MVTLPDLMKFRSMTLETLKQSIPQDKAEHMPLSIQELETVSLSTYFMFFAYIATLCDREIERSFGHNKPIQYTATLHYGVSWGHCQLSQHLLHTEPEDRGFVDFTSSLAERSRIDERVTMLGCREVEWIHDPLKSNCPSLISIVLG